MATGKALSSLHSKCNGEEVLTPTVIMLLIEPQASIVLGLTCGKSYFNKPVALALLSGATEEHNQPIPPPSLHIKL